MNSLHVFPSLDFSPRHAATKAPAAVNVLSTKVLGNRVRRELFEPKSGGWTKLQAKTSEVRREVQGASRCNQRGRALQQPAVIALYVKGPAHFLRSRE